MSGFWSRLIPWRRLRLWERRWPVPIRGLLLFGLVLAIAAGWLMWRVIDDNRIFRRSAPIAYAYFPYPIRCDWLPQAVEGWLEDDRLVLFPRCIGVVWVGAGDDPALVRWMSRMRGCTTIGFKGSPVPELLAAVDGAPELAELCIDGNYFSSWMNDRVDPIDFDLSRLTSLPRLKRLTLRDVSLDSAGIGVVRRFIDLESLELPGVPLTRDLIQAICGLQHLQDFTATVDVEQNSETQRRALMELHRLPEKCDITVTLKKADDAVLKLVATLPQLRQLTLVRGTVTDQGIASLAAHPRLSTVHLGALDGITDESCSTLATLPELVEISLTFTPVTLSGLRRLTSAPKLATVAWDPNFIVPQETWESLRSILPKIEFHEAGPLGRNL